MVSKREEAFAQVHIKRSRDRNPQKMQQKRATRPWLDHQQFGTSTELKNPWPKVNSEETMDAIDQNENGRDQNQEELTACQSKLQTMFSIFLGSDNFMFWDKFLEDELNICKTDHQVKEFALYHSKMVLEILKSWIAKS